MMMLDPAVLEWFEHKAKAESNQGTSAVAPRQQSPQIAADRILPWNPRLSS
jgi:hypothetical protein